MSEGLTRPDYALPEGTHLRGGNFVIGAFLGLGVFGLTYAARDTARKCTVAIKEFFPKGCGRAATHLSEGGGWTLPVLNEYRQQFVDEGRILSAVKNPGIVAVHQVFEEYGTAYLVMEYIEGRTVEQLALTRGGRLPEAIAVALVRQCCEAVAVLHKVGLLHGNITPQNMMLRPDGHVALIGFGASWDFVPDTFFSQTEVYTPGFAPLELYSRTGRRGPYTDIYGLSASLYYLLTGVVPVPAPDRISGIPLPAPQQMDVIATRTVSDAIMDGLAIDVAARPQTIEAFLRLLYGDTGAPPTDPASATAPTAPSGPTGTASDVINLPSSAAFKADIDASIASAINRRFTPKLIGGIAAVILLAIGLPTAIIIRQQQVVAQEQADAAAKASQDPKQAFLNHPLDVISSGACLKHTDADNDVAILNLGHAVNKVYVWVKLQNNLSDIEAQDVTVNLQVSGPVSMSLPFTERIESSEDTHTVVCNFEMPPPGLPSGHYNYTMIINNNQAVANGAFTVS